MFAKKINEGESPKKKPMQLIFHIVFSILQEQSVQGRSVRKNGLMVGLEVCCTEYSLLETFGV